MTMTPKDMDEILENEAKYGPGVWKDGYYFSALYMSGHKGLKQALESGQIEGVPFKVTGRGTDIQPEDSYIAERNTGLKLLTCRRNDLLEGWVVAKEPEYSYDTGECIRIELAL